MQQHLFEYFISEGLHCFLEEIFITFIDKTDLSEPFIRDNYWRSIVKTIAPWGLNVEDSV